MSKQTDLIIIGAGPGGYRAAEYAAKQGLKVTIFEGSEVGGTCLNVGCIPTKTYVHAATFEEARQRMAEVIPQLRQGVETILSHPNITLVRSRARFVDTHTVCSLSGDSVAAPNIIIATGSETKWLPIEGVKTDPRVVDSTGLLALDHLPKRLAIIGAGVIGMEFASVFHRFGSEVTVIEYLKECLPALDSDIAKRLRKHLEKQGITFNMQCAVTGISDGVVRFATKKGQTESVSADIILMATGRRPHTDGLNLPADIALTPQGAIPVDDNFEVMFKPQTINFKFHARPKDACYQRDARTSNFKLYAIGDVNGRQMLAHAAEMQAVRAVNHILGKQDNIRFDIMPAAIFTTPEAACVGPTEEQLKEQGITYICHKSFWRANGKAMAMGETEGMLKLFAAPDDGLILGCHAYGAHATDIIQEVSALMCRHTTVGQLRDIIHIHPTLSEILKTAVE